jgi:hypothetical protein
MSFCGEVDLEQVAWADDGSQVIVTRASPRWPDVEARARGGDQVAWSLTMEVKGRQGWALLSRNDMTRQDWDFYSSRFGGRSGDGSDLLPGLGVGRVAVRLPGLDGSVREVGTWDLELSPSPVDLLAQLLGLDPEAHPTTVLVADSETRMSYRVNRTVIRRLEQPVESGFADRWAEELSANGYFLWAENAADLMAVLHREASRNPAVDVILELTP